MSKIIMINVNNVTISEKIFCHIVEKKDSKVVSGSKIDTVVYSLQSPEISG